MQAFRSLTAYLFALTWRQKAGLVSAVLVVVALFFYLPSIWQGKTRPSIVSWSIWIVLTTGIVGAMWQANKLNPQIIVVAVLNLPVLCVVLLFGQVKWTNIDVTCAVLGVVGIAAWGWWRKSWVGLSISLAVDILATGPTWEYNWFNPGQEEWYAWGIMAASSTLAVLSVEKWKGPRAWEGWAQPAVFCLLHNSMLYLTLVRPWLLA